GMGTANARDLSSLRRTLQRIPRIKKMLANAESARLVSLRGELGELDDLADVVTLIAAALVDEPPLLLRDGGLIRAGYHPELNNLREAAAAGRAWLTEYEAQQRERTGISNLRVRYNQVFGFFVEVPRSKSGQVPDEYERKATISHAERFITPDLRAREAEILSTEERANELEYDLFVELRQTVAAQSDRLRRAARILAEVDVLAGLAETAVQQNYARPVVDESDTIHIEEGRHPVVERLLPEGSRFVANDIRLDGTARRLLIVTGPNMSGKSVLSRQAALTVLMAQIGSFVPARSAHIGLVDRIFVRAGASDDITQGRSTFLVEMSETAYILRHATARSLVVLDEVGRGTSTYDGMALAWAVGEELHSRIAARTLFATHFHELTGLAEELEGAQNVSLAVVEQGHEVVFLYRLVDEGADRSYGVQVARLAGVPEHVVQRARELMERMAGAGESPAQALTAQASTPQTSTDGEEPSLPAAVGMTLREVSPAYRTGDGLLAPVDDELVWAVVRELFRQDVANLTPVRALVLVNEWQQRLRGEG
ncbi:MAG: DNA mismatch repair protein MutS, partial [Caldilineaceae bacterium]